MAQMNMVQAINSAMDIMLAAIRCGVDGRGHATGGVFRCTDGLQRKYGDTAC
jgi:2-oxoisovalerate dehydrogenase E1 component beta subunit